MWRCTRMRPPLCCCGLSGTCGGSCSCPCCWWRRRSWRRRAWRPALRRGRACPLQRAGGGGGGRPRPGDPAPPVPAVLDQGDGGGDGGGGRGPRGGVGGVRLLAAAGWARARRGGRRGGRGCSCWRPRTRPARRPVPRGTGACGVAAGARPDAPLPDAAVRGLRRGARRAGLRRGVAPGAFVVVVVVVVVVVLCVCGRVSVCVSVCVCLYWWRRRVLVHVENCRWRAHPSAAGPTRLACCTRAAQTPCSAHGCVVVSLARGSQHVLSAPFNTEHHRTHHSCPSLTATAATPPAHAARYRAGPPRRSQPG